MSDYVVAHPLQRYCKNLKRNRDLLESPRLRVEGNRAAALHLAVVQVDVGVVRRRAAGPIVLSARTGAASASHYFYYENYILEFKLIN